MANSITVSQLKCACIDPAWRESWLQGKNPSTLECSASGGVNVYGRTFHTLANYFVKWLCEQPAPETAAMRSPEQIWHAMYDHFAAIKLSKITAENKAEAALRLKDCLQAFCQQLDALRSRTAGFQTWQDVFLGREYDLKNIPVNTAAGVLYISGRTDIVRTHPAHALELVDYKLSQGSQAKHDLIQLAIYAHMLNIAKPGLHPHGVLEYYQPALQKTELTAAELTALFNEMVLPVLPQLLNAPGAPKSAVLAPPKEPDKKSAAKAQAIDARAQAMQNCFAAFKLDVQVTGCIEAPQLWRYQIKPAEGVKVVSLANRAEDLQVHLNLPQAPMIAPAQGCVAIDIPKSKPDAILWRDVVRRPEFVRNPSPMAFPIGIGVEGQLLVADFADPNCCHALVAGGTGSGKSEFLKSLVATLIVRNQPDRLKLAIVDPKFLTFGWLAGCPHLIGPVITDIQSAMIYLDYAVNEMDARYKIMAERQATDLAQLIAAGSQDIPYLAIIIDEFADLILAGKEVKANFERLVARLAAKGRAAGIHLVLTTQRPEQKIVTGLIKANLPLKICLRVNSAVNSTIILDETGGEKLMGRGDLFCKRNQGLERAQAPYITPEELDRFSRKNQS